MKFRRAAGWARAVSLAATLPWAAGEAEAAETASAAAPNDYVVFVGLDVFAADGAKRRLLVDASGHDGMFVDQAGATPLLLRDVPLEAEVAPKLSRAGVTVADLNGAPVYSVNADPGAEAQDQQMTIDAMQNQVRDQADSGQRDATRYNAQTANSGDAGAMADAQQVLNAANTRLDEVHATAVLRGALPGSGDSGAGPDGFEVSFRVSAPESHARAYGVVRLFIRDPRQTEATLQALKIFRLRELTPQPRRTVVWIQDVPPGFIVESYEVHIYADGRELATNLSSNRVELTADEAHQYLILRHTHLNRGATIPAQVLVELAPSAAAAGLVAGQEGTLVNFRITADGKVAHMDGDAAIPIPLSPRLQAAVREVRFLPALVAGQPAASTGTFALGELFLAP